MNHSSTQIMLLHGWALNHHIFDHFCQNWPSELCLTPDLAGHGHAPYSGEFDLLSIAKDMLKKITAPIHLIGWSLGGHIAQLMAAIAPEKIKTLTLISSFAHLADKNPAQNQRLVSIRQALTEDYAKNMCLFIKLHASTTTAGKAITDEILPAILASPEPLALETAQTALEKNDNTSILNQIQAPTLLIFGEKDRITPPKTGYYLHKHIQNSQLVLFKKSAHMPFITEEAHCQQLLTQFWNTPI